MPHGDRFVEQHGIAHIYETHEHGLLTGYRITCGRHQNGPLDNTACMKHLPLGKGTGTVQLSRSECILRLKRWFVLGNTPAAEAKWGEQEQRTGHVKGLGGSRLAALGSDGGLLSDVSEEDLNRMCTSISPI